MKINRKQFRKDLRLELINKRKTLSTDFVNDASIKVFTKLKQHEFLQDQRLIASYSSTNGEINTHFINQYLIDNDHRIALPYVHSAKNGSMDFYLVDDLKNLVNSKWNILEPEPFEENKARYDLIEIMIVPLIAFDKNGNRLGMGGGFYDRAIKKLSANCITIGLAYDFQMQNNIYAENWDMPLDEVITENNHYIFSKKY